MNCRIAEWQTLRGPMTPARVLNAMLLRWATNYENREVREWYELGMSFYEKIEQRAVSTVSA